MLHRRQFATFITLARRVAHPALAWWFISAAATGFLFMLLVPLATHSVVPLFLFITSSLSPGLVVACVTFAHLAVSAPVAAGREGVTLHGPLILLLYLLVHCWYSVVTWSEGVFRYGVGHVVAVNAIAFGVVFALMALYVHQRRRPSRFKALLFYSGLALWPCLIAFPFLFEGP